MYVITHVFSRRNAGDGLLVDLTLKACSDAGISSEECTLLALDAESFHDFAHVCQAPGEPSARVSARSIHAGAVVVANSISTAIGSRARFGSAAQLLANAKAIIGVGGGYLVCDSPTRSAGVLLNHLIQLEVASRAVVPTVYMPQSVGPLPGIVGRRVANALRNVDRVYLRDDESISELGSTSNVRRCADLAVLQLARKMNTPDFSVHSGENTIIVGRGLPGGGTYSRNIVRLAGLCHNHTWAIQADVLGPRSDRAFYDRIGVSANRSLADSLAQIDGGVVVSTRLHGAIAALLAGWPAIHLAYERKGWGAYEDLGLEEFVHNARDFDPQLVNNQIRALRADSESFWGRINEKSASLRTQYSDLVEDLRTRLLQV